jgi:hypothetical protein
LEPAAEMKKLLKQNGSTMPMCFGSNVFWLKVFWLKSAMELERKENGQGFD